MAALYSFLAVFVPLLIIMDPLGNLPFFLLFTRNNSLVEQYNIAAVASVAAGLILVFFGVTGDFVLRFFSIELPAFQIAGGFVFFVYALQMMRLIPSGMKTSEEEEQEGVVKENAALVPLATPMLAGPGAITAVLVWKQDPGYSTPMVLLLAAIVCSCLIVYLVFRFGPGISRLMGVGGLRVVSRLMGLLLAVIAVQFMMGGFRAFFS